MRPIVCATVIGVLAAAGPSPHAESRLASANIVATASFLPRTSLTVSTDVLRFHVPQDEAEATAIVEFSAATRAHPQAEVVLSVEPLRAPAGPGGAADVGVELSFAGDGPGTEMGTLSIGSTSSAARWIGGGKRHGTIAFTLRAATPGDYVVPVQFLIRVR